MKNRWFAPVLVVLLAASAHATTLVSPELEPAPLDQFVCRIVNAGTESIIVDIGIVSDFGGELSTSADGVVVDAGRSTLVSDGDNGGAPLHCVFSGNFPKGKVRATAEIFTRESGDTARSATVLRAE